MRQWTSLPTEKLGRLPKVRISLKFRSWPRACGAVLYAGKILGAAGCDAISIALLSYDVSGLELIHSARQDNLRSSEGSVVVTGERTSKCVLVHQPSGRYCFFDTCFGEGGYMTDDRRTFWSLHLGLLQRRGRQV